MRFNTSGQVFIRKNRTTVSWIGHVQQIPEQTPIFWIFKRFSSLTLCLPANHIIPPMKKIVDCSPRCHLSKSKCRKMVYEKLSFRFFISLKWIGVLFNGTGNVFSLGILAETFGCSFWNIIRTRNVCINLNVRTSAIDWQSNIIW